MGATTAKDKALLAIESETNSPMDVVLRGAAGTAGQVPLDKSSQVHSSVTRIAGASIINCDSIVDSNHLQLCLDVLLNPLFLLQLLPMLKLITRPPRSLGRGSVM